tara:strand:- start:65 stop:301 length:237 start_codon:yes stop_codon:yes gene_type:complete
MTKEGFIIDTPEGIELYRIFAIHKALKLEVELGLKHSKGNLALHRAREILENPKLNKKQALKGMDNLVDEMKNGLLAL